MSTIVGPLLFLIYINDLPHCLQTTTASMFADDTNLFCTGRTSADIEYKISKDQGRRKGGAQGGALPPLPFLKGGRGGAKVPFYKLWLFKNEQALAEVIICVNVESGGIAHTKMLP